MAVFSGPEGKFEKTVIQSPNTRPPSAVGGGGGFGPVFLVFSG
jgi:hypothetical protein